MTVSKGTTLFGELRTNNKIKLEGRVEGSGIINNTLLVSSDGVWIGNIIADVVIVDGTVEGNIVAKQKLLLLANAKVFGSLYSKNIHVEKGAVLTGKLQMNAPAPLALINDPLNYKSDPDLLESGVLETAALTDVLENNTSAGSRKLTYPKVGVA